MIMMNPSYKPATVDGYLRHVAAGLHDHRLSALAPMSWSDWYEYAVMDAGLTEEAIQEQCLVYYPHDNSWAVPSKAYSAIQLVCSTRLQPRKATLAMECTLRNESTYTLRYKETGYRVDENPDITHNGETKPLIEWGEVLDVCPSTMQQRYAKMQQHGETIAWLLRPKYTHGKLCGEQA